MDKVYIDKLSDSEDKKAVITSKFVNNLLNLEFIYPSDFKYTKDLRDFIFVIGNFFGFSEKLTTRLILISDELNNNAIEYGSSKNGKNIMRIILKKTESSIFLNLEVEDNGDGKAPKTSLEMETMRAHKLKRGYFNHNSIRGRGLFLITVQMVDRLYFKNTQEGGLKVGVKLEIKNKI